MRWLEILFLIKPSCTYFALVMVSMRYRLGRWKWTLVLILWRYSTTDPMVGHFSPSASAASVSTILRTPPSGVSRSRKRFTSRRLSSLSLNLCWLCMTVDGGKNTGAAGVRWGRAGEDFAGVKNVCGTFRVAASASRRILCRVSTNQLKICRFKIGK